MLLGSFSTNGEYCALGNYKTASKQIGADLKNLGDGFYAALRRHPYGLTEASMVVTAKAVSSISATLCNGAAMSPLRVQYSSGVVCVDEVNKESKEASTTTEDTASLTSRVIAVKRTIGPIRFLFLLPPTMVYSTTESSESPPLKDVLLSDPEQGKRVFGLSLHSGISDLAPLSLSGIISYTRDSPSSTLQSVANDLTSIGVTRLESKFEGLCSWIRRFIQNAHVQSSESKITGPNSFWELEADVTKEASFKLKPIKPCWIIQRKHIDLMLMAPSGSDVRGSDANVLPSKVNPPSLKRPREEDDSRRSGETRKIGDAVSSIPLLPSSNMSEVFLAVIVPFRDQPEQNRALQLSRFCERLPLFLTTIQPRLGGFHVIIVEQTHDGYKFNRGKALNAGFIMATASNRADIYGAPFSKSFNAFCFHDVDLLPGPGLGPWYAKHPDRPIHVGSAWGRYPYPNYIGGILTLSERDVRSSNGFPNNFWGWGGEDDEMFARLRDANLLPVEKVPSSVANTAKIIEDLEETIIQERGGERAGTSVKDGGRAEWRNMLKHEGIDRHASTWRSNGINAVDFTVKKVRHVNNSVTIVSVDLHGERDDMSQKQTSEDRK